MVNYLGQDESAALEFNPSMQYVLHTKQINKALEKTIAKLIAGFSKLR